MDELKLRGHFYTTLDFNTLKNKIKNKIGLNYKLGFIDNEEINVYYLNDLYTQNGLDRVPFCQIRIKNEKQADGRLKITFGIADFVLVLMSVIPLLFLIILYFNAGPKPIYVALGFYFVEYIACKYAFANQSFKFQRDLKKLEAE